MKTRKFARKPFYVDAIRVSMDNIEEVATWCEGAVEIDTDEQPFIRVKVYRPLNERQTQAFLGDWVLFAGTGFKVYTPKAFDKSFEKVKTLTKEQADEAGIKVPHEPSQKPTPVKKGPRQLVTNVGKAVREAEKLKVAQKGSGHTTEINFSEAPPKSKADVEAERLIAEVRSLK